MTFLLVAEIIRAEAREPLPSKSSTMSSGFNLSTAERCRGWLSVSSMVGAVMLSQ